MAGKINRKDRKARESKLLGILLLLKKQRSTMEKKEFLQRLEEYRTGKAEYEKEMMAAEQQPLDFEAKADVIINGEKLLTKGEEIQRLKETAEEYEAELQLRGEIAISNEQVFRGTISSLQRDIERLKERKPIIIYKNSELFKNANKPETPPSNDSKKIIKSLTESIEKKIKEKNMYKEQNEMYKRELNNLNVKFQEKYLQEEIKSRCVILEDEFESLWK